MKSPSLEIIIALLLVSLAAVPTDAQKQTTRARQEGSIRVECFKRYGAAYDATTKKWVLHIWSESDLISKLDAVRDCISRGTGIPRDQITIPEVPVYD